MPYFRHLVAKRECFPSLARLCSEASLLQACERAATQPRRPCVARHQPEIDVARRASQIGGGRRWRGTELMLHSAPSDSSSRAARHAFFQQPRSLDACRAAPLRALHHVSSRLRAHARQLEESLRPAHPKCPVPLSRAPMWWRTVEVASRGCDTQEARPHRLAPASGTRGGASARRRRL